MTDPLPETINPGEEEVRSFSNSSLRTNGVQTRERTDPSSPPMDSMMSGSESDRSPRASPEKKVGSSGSLAESDELTSRNSLWMSSSDMFSSAATSDLLWGTEEEANPYRDEIVRTIFGDVGAIRRDFSCAIERKILLHGRLYVTDRFICFYSNLFGFEKKIKIPYSYITCITKEYTAVFIPNAIAVITARREYIFRSFWDRDECYAVLKQMHDMYRGVVETGPNAHLEEGNAVGASAILGGSSWDTRGDNVPSDDDYEDSVDRRDASAGGPGVTDVPRGVGERKAHKIEARRASGLRREPSVDELVPTVAAAAATKEQKEPQPPSSATTATTTTPPPAPVVVESSSQPSSAPSTVAPPPHGGRERSHPGEPTTTTVKKPTQQQQERKTTRPKVALPPAQPKTSASAPVVKSEQPRRRTPPHLAAAESAGSIISLGNITALGALAHELQSTTLPCTIEQFFGHFLADGAPCSLAKFHEFQRDAEVTVTPWTEVPPKGPHPDSSEHTRVLRFRRRLKSPIGPASTRTTKMQRCRTFGRRGIVVNTVMTMEDIPYRDCFTVEDRWVAEPTADKQKTRIRFEFQVVWTKTTIWKRRIEASSKADLESFYDAYVHAAHAYLDDIADKLAAEKKIKPKPPPPAEAIPIPASRFDAARDLVNSVFVVHRSSWLFVVFILLFITLLKQHYALEENFKVQQQLLQELAALRSDLECTKKS